jgi:glycosyltransferase involved in cell wall biosynthesis
MGVKTVMQYNYEFLDYFLHPEWPKPDVLLAPSKWNMDKITDWGIDIKYLPVPVNRTVFPFREKNEAKTFLHVAGHSTYADRNGTQTVLDAIQYVKSDIKFMIRSQYNLPHFVSDYRVTVHTGDAPNYWELYNGEDVLLLPRKYGGLSLQLNEAMSTGMIPLMLDVVPQNEFLAPEMLIPATHVDTISPRTVIQVHSCTPQELATKIDEVAGYSEDKIKELSNFSDKYATDIDWEKMTPIYLETLEQCL